MAQSKPSWFEGGQLQFLYRQFILHPKAVTPQQINLQGKTAIVTGSNVGLGLEASRQLLGLGLSHLIMAVRDKGKGDAARQELLKQAPNAVIETWILDMSSYDSIEAFARRCRSIARIDFVILNAGVARLTFGVAKATGHEEVLQVNFLSTALLAILLLPVLSHGENKIPSSKPGRMVIVSSDTSDWAKFKEQSSDPILPAFDDPKNFDMLDRYYTSKLLGQLFLIELAKRIPSSVVQLNSVNPGFCHGSSLHRDLGGVLGFMLSFMKRITGRSTSVGASCLVDAAVLHGNEVHGRFLSDQMVQPFARFTRTARGQEVGMSLWEETLEELSAYEVQGILDRCANQATKAV